MPSQSSSAVVGLHPGEVRRFVMGSLPAGWLPCDGRHLRIARYRPLYEAIGAGWGAAPAGTFRLPDLIGRLPVHPAPRGESADARAGGTRGLPIAFAEVHDASRAAGSSPARLQPRPAPWIYAISAQADPDLPGGGETPWLGEVRLYAGAEPPAGWLPCDGQTLAYSAHPALAALLDDTWGGDGHSRFGLPDLRGRGLATARSVPAPLGDRHPQPGPLPMVEAADAGAHVGLLHLIASAGELPGRQRRQA